MKILYLGILFSLFFIGIRADCPSCPHNLCQESHCNITTNFQCAVYPKNCNDYSECTLDSCDLSVGCIHTPIDCNGKDKCYHYYCDYITGCYGLRKRCSDNNVCTHDSCDPATGNCINTPIMCDDGDACTKDTCDPIAGCVHLPLNCDDGHSCTTDTCSKTTGCVNTPINDCVECSGNQLPCVSTEDKCNPSVCDPFNPGQCIVYSINCNQSNPCISTYCKSSTGECIFNWICETPQPTQRTNTPSITPTPSIRPNTLATTTATTTSRVSTTAGTTGHAITTPSTIATTTSHIATTTSHITRPPRPDEARPSDLLRGCLSCEDLNCHSEVSNDGNIASCIYVKNDIDFDEDDCSDCCKWTPTCSFNNYYPQQYY